MPTAAERIYELARDGLAEQERQVSEVRGRGPALLAVGAVIASLLARPAFGGAHPDDWQETVCVITGLVGCAVLLLAVVLLLRPYELGFSVNTDATYNALWQAHVLAQPDVDVMLAETLQARREANAPIAQRLVALLALALTALVFETVGFAAAAALAS